MITKTNTSKYSERKIDKNKYRVQLTSNGTMVSTINNNVVFQDIPGNLFDIAKNMPDNLFVNTFFKDSILRQEYYSLKQSIGNDNKGIKYEFQKENMDHDNWITLNIVGLVNGRQVSTMSLDCGTEDSAKRKFYVSMNITDNETLNFRFLKVKEFSHATFLQYKKLIEKVDNIDILEYLIFGLMTNVLGDYMEAPKKICKEIFKTSTIIATIVSILSLIVAIGLILWRVSSNKLKKLELQREVNMKEE